eukprot:669273-Pleurochrysis_carterae.AAC.2
MKGVLSSRAWQESVVQLELADCFNLLVGASIAPTASQRGAATPLGRPEEATGCGRPARTAKSQESSPLGTEQTLLHFGLAGSSSRTNTGIEYLLSPSSARRRRAARRPTPRRGGAGTDDSDYPGAVAYGAEHPAYWETI